MNRQELIGNLKISLGHPKRFTPTYDSHTDEELAWLFSTVQTTLLKSAWMTISREPVGKPVKALLEESTWDREAIEGALIRIGEVQVGREGKGVGEINEVTLFELTRHT